MLVVVVLLLVELLGRLDCLPDDQHVAVLSDDLEALRANAQVLAMLWQMGAHLPHLLLSFSSYFICRISRKSPA